MHRTNGQVTLTQDKNGKLEINVFIDTSPLNKYSASELFGHEAIVHLEKIDEIIAVFEKEGFEAAQRYRASLKGNVVDHIALRDQDTEHKGYKKYDKLKSELIKMDKKYEEAFENKANEYKEKYKNLK